MKNKDMPAMAQSSGFCSSHGFDFGCGLTKEEYARIHAPAMSDSFLDAWHQQLTVEEVELYFLDDDGQEVVEMNMYGFKEAHKAWLDHCVGMALGSEE